MCWSERQAPGVCHRLFIVKGRLLYAVKRLPIFVTGDGTRTLRQIIAAEIETDLARPHWRRSKIADFDAAGFAGLAASGIDCDAVPGFGTRVFLRPIETTEWGGIDEDTTGIVHPLNLKAAVEATQAFGLEVSGVDMISEDISVPWHENGAVINEVNAGPLLGGGDISRSHLATFLDIYLGGNGSIPVVEAAPGESFEALRAGQAAQLAKGIRSWIVFADVAIGPHGETLRPDLTPGAMGFDPKGRPLRVISPPEDLLLQQVLRYRAVDHVVRVRGEVSATALDAAGRPASDAVAPVAHDARLCDPARGSQHHHVRRHILVNGGARGDDGIGADLDTWCDAGSRTDECAAADPDL